jgi:hypothetical protein
MVQDLAAEEAAEDLAAEDPNPMHNGLFWNMAVDYFFLL